MYSTCTGTVWIAPRSVVKRYDWHQNKENYRVEFKENGRARDESQKPNRIALVGAQSRNFLNAYIFIYFTFFFVGFSYKIIKRVSVRIRTFFTITIPFGLHLPKRIATLPGMSYMNTGEPTTSYSSLKCLDQGSAISFYRGSQK